MLCRFLLPCVLVAASCEAAGEQAAPDAAGGSADAMADAGDGAGWQVRVDVETVVLEPSPETGCLSESATVLASGDVVDVLASDGWFFLIDEDGSCVTADDVTELDRPDELAPGRPGVVQRDSMRYAYGDDGCPAPGDELVELTQVVALARSHDASYRGFVVIDRDLGLAPVRVVDADGWQYPWHAAVQLVKQVPGGFVIGGGVIIGPNTIVTAGHLGVDESWCYIREPNTGRAWEDELAVCDNITGRTNHPSGVDVAVVSLANPVDPPFAALRVEHLEPGEAVYSSKYSQLHRHAFADSSVAGVGDDNAWCDPWPASSSFATTDLIVAGGDSGGPVFAGDELVGIVHGERCRNAWEDPQHLFVHLPGVGGFLTAAQ